MPGLDIRHLRAICAIADTGSLSKAAVRLGLTQPALSAQLHRVERLVGGQLFDRSPAGSTPTELGRYVIGVAEMVLNDVEHLLDSARGRAGRPPSAQPLLVGCMPMPMVAPMVAELRRRVPCSELRTEIDTSAAGVLDKIATGRVQLAVLERFEGIEKRQLSGVQLRTLITEPQFIGLADRHPLASRPVVDLADLAGDHWVTPPPDSNSLLGSLNSACAAVGYSPKIRHHTGEAGTARALIMAGAVALASPCSRSGDGIVIRPLRGTPLRLPILVAIRSDGPLVGRGQEAFAAVARAYRSTVDRNPDFMAWWVANPLEHAELDAALESG
ncbi:LysR family transcriptional regulator [Pseudonocardiaceae bacterium YIM PH 21723]|nr:LysR family transcriptional regulator [Pseudonocardiaceae bacterium YIM PH 21723]